MIQTRSISPLRVLYRDETLLAVDKPSGLVVHRGWATDKVTAMTLARQLAGQWVYPAHRLDRATSGVLVFALDPKTAANLERQFAQRVVEKEYLALTRSWGPAGPTLVDYPLEKKKGHPKVAAQTWVETLERYELDWSPEGGPVAWRPACATEPGPHTSPASKQPPELEPPGDLPKRWPRRYSWILARPLTGRPHQIRRHLRHLGLPIIGDVRYGKSEHNRIFRQSFALPRLALHAARMRFEHPATGRRLDLRARLPAELAQALEQLSAFPQTPEFSSVPVELSEQT